MHRRPACQIAISADLTRHTRQRARRLFVLPQLDPVAAFRELLYRDLSYPHFGSCDRRRRPSRRRPLLVGCRTALRLPPLLGMHSRPCPRIASRKLADCRLQLLLLMKGPVVPLQYRRRYPAASTGFPGNKSSIVRVLSTC